MKKRLADHKSSQCYVIIDGADVHFISYTTRVISIMNTPEGRKIECTGTYSATTRKQIGWFLKEYAADLCYYDMKAIVGAGAVAM